MQPDQVLGFGVESKMLIVLCSVISKQQGGGEQGHIRLLLHIWKVATTAEITIRLSLLMCECKKKKE